MRAYFASETPDYQVEFRARHRDGSYRWILSRGVAVRDASGKPIRFAGIRIDITDRKRIEEELRQANARLDLAVRGSNVGIWENDFPDGDYHHGKVHCINIFEQLGYTPPASTTDYAAVAVPYHPEDAPRVQEALRAYFAGETPDYRVEFRARHRDGSYRWILTRGVAVRDASGKPIRFTGTRIDITDLKRIEEELRQAKEAAEAASRAKSEFLANVSHEIRTPMNGILGMTDLALDTRLSEEQRKYLTIINASADSLLSVINDLLDFSKIEAGKLQLDHAEFSLRCVLNETLRGLAHRAHKKKLELVCNVRPEVPDSLIGDAGRLRQVLVNLVGNAIKFTEVGEVVVEVGTLTTDDTDGTDKDKNPSSSSSVPSVSSVVQLYFSVRDTGIGIPTEKQGKIFHAFEQADTSTTRRYGGTGLGLSIASWLVGLMAGQICVESEQGCGSVFRFTAEFGRAPGAAAARPRSDLSGLRVLVVDDNETNRLILEEWLRGWEVEPTAVPDGLSALNALWQALSQGSPFAVVLLDSRMPGIDGPTLAAQIRRSPPLSGCPIILLTSEDQPADRDRLRELGLAAVVTKPVPEEELFATVCRVLASEKVIGDQGLVIGEEEDKTVLSSSPITNHQSPITIPTRPLRVLVAEDHELNQQVVQHLLARHGHTVEIAPDGRAALAALEQGEFDALLLDVHMPELDGFQVIKALRQREQGTGRHLPVVGLTARTMKGDRERCLEAGMDDFLGKPIRRVELFAALERVLASEDDKVTRWQGDKVTEHPSPCHPVTLSPCHPLDAATLLTACDGDEGLLARMIAVFRASTPVQLQRVAAAVRDRDPDRLREAAHRLRGVVSAFSTSAAAAALRLEQAGADQRLDGVDAVLGSLTALVAEMTPLLDTLTVEELRSRLR